MLGSGRFARDEVAIVLSDHSFATSIVKQSFLCPINKDQVGFREMGLNVVFYLYVCAYMSFQ